MKIPVTEKYLKEYIDEIVELLKESKFTPNLCSKRNYNIISEGLIMTYAPHKLISILNKKYDFSKIYGKVNVFDRISPSLPINKQKGSKQDVRSTRDYNRFFEIYINFKRGLKDIDGKILNDIKHTCESCGWFFAPVQDMYTLKEYKTLDNPELKTNHSCNIYFRPKFDQEVKKNGIPERCYHICPTRLVEKILRQGLHPKDYGRTSNHPERVYLFLNKPIDWKDIANNFKESREDYYSLLEINMITLFDKMKFYFDSLTMTDNPAIYTTETIPPQYIRLIDQEQ